MAFFDPPKVTIYAQTGEVLESATTVLQVTTDIPPGTNLFVLAAFAGGPAIINAITDDSGNTWSAAVVRWPGWGTVTKGWLHVGKTITVQMWNTFANTFVAPPPGNPVTMQLFAVGVSGTMRWEVDAHDDDGYAFTDGTVNDKTDPATGSRASHTDPKPAGQNIAPRWLTADQPTPPSYELGFAVLNSAQIKNDRYLDVLNSPALEPAPDLWLLPDPPADWTLLIDASIVGGVSDKINLGNPSFFFRETKRNRLRWYYQWYQVRKLQQLPNGDDQTYLFDTTKNFTNTANTNATLNVAWWSWRTALPFPGAAIVRDWDEKYLHFYADGKHTGRLLMDVYGLDLKFRQTKVVDADLFCQFPSFYLIDGLLCGTYRREDTMLFAYSGDHGDTWQTLTIPTSQGLGGGPYGKMTSVYQRGQVIVFGYSGEPSYLNGWADLYFQVGALKKASDGTFSIKWGTEQGWQPNVSPEWDIRDAEPSGEVAGVFLLGGVPQWRHYRAQYLGLAGIGSNFVQVSQVGALAGGSGFFSDLPPDASGEYYAAVRHQVHRGRLLLFGWKNSTRQWYLRSATWIKKSNTPTAANPNIVWSSEAALLVNGAPVTGQPIAALKTLGDGQVVFGYLDEAQGWHLILARDLGVDNTATWFPFTK